MQGYEFILLVLLASAIAIPILTGFIQHYEDLRNAKARRSGAKTWDEYVYWTQELRCLRWCVLPGLTPRRVRQIAKWFRHLFYKPKHLAEKEQNDGLLDMLAPSLLGICICCVCLVSLSYAWFTADVQSKPSTLTAASYEISVSITGGNQTYSEVTGNSGTYSLKGGNTYTVKLTATGTASTGYCVIKSGDQKWYTDQISEYKPLTFTITPSEDAEFTFEACWGTYSDKADVNNNGALYCSTAAEETNTDPTVGAEPTEPAAPVTEATEATEITTPPAETTAPTTEPPETTEQTTSPPEATEQAEETTEPPVTSEPTEETEGPTEAPTAEE